MIKFGTGGFRGVISEEFNPENIRKISHGIAKYIIKNNLKKEVVVSYDLRDKSYESAILIANILSGYNIKIYLSNEATPSPVAMFITMKKNLDIGIMVTASHNPPQYNGIKLFETGGYDASVETTNKVENLINSDHVEIEYNKSLIIDTNMLNDYFVFLKDFIDIKNNDKKILFDFIYGVGSKTIPPMLKYYGLNNVEYRRGIRDDNYYHVMPNPIEQNLKYNKDYLDFDLVLGLDADADRIGILDDQGNYVDSNEIMALIYYYLIKYKGLHGSIVKNISTSNLIDKISEKLGETVYTTDVGFKNITAKMAEVDALIGGESSGGMTIRNYIKGKDSTLSALLIIEIISKLDKPLSELIKIVRDEANFYNKSIEKEIKYKNKEELISFIEDNKLIVNAQITERIKYNTNYKYFLENDDWLILRFSGTEPVLRVMAETKDIEYSNKILDSVIRQLEGI